MIYIAARIERERAADEARVKCERAPPGCRAQPPTPYGASRACWNCGKRGHKYNRCPAPLRWFCQRCGRPGKHTRECCGSTRTPKTETRATPPVPPSARNVPERPNTEGPPPPTPGPSISSGTSGQSPRPQRDPRPSSRGALRGRRRLAVESLRRVAAAFLLPSDEETD